MKPFFAALSLAALLLGGCGSSDERDFGGTVDPKATQDFSAQIKQIEDNPNMPQGAKDAALAELRTRQAQSDARKATAK